MVDSERYMFRPMSAEEEFHAALLNFGVSEVPTQTAEATLQYPHPPSLHELHCHPTLFIHSQMNQRGKTQGLTSLDVCEVYKENKAYFS